MTSSFGFLQYPQQLETNQVDYMTFTPHAYETNENGANGPQTGETIILYMPNSTPTASSRNNWGEFNAAGPLGAAMRGLATGATEGLMGYGTEGFSEEDFIDKVKAQAEATGQNAAPIAKQSILQMAAGIAGYTPNALLSYSRGEVYNPNIELVYQSPVLRSFAFAFQFIPKNPSESQDIHRIIKHFRTYSAPQDRGGFYKIPDVWVVKYMSNGEENKNMTSFKRMVCRDVSVQANASTNMHQSFSDGMPVSTTLGLDFQEVDIILRDDHESEEASLQGF